MDNKETDKSQMNGSMKDMNQLHLEKITYLNWHDVEDLRLTKEQKNYLPDNVSNLALAGVIREAGFHVFTFGIYLGEKPIGFVMIGYDIPFDPEDDLNDKYWFYTGQLLYLAFYDRQTLSEKRLRQASAGTHTRFHPLRPMPKGKICLAVLCE